MLWNLSGRDIALEPHTEVGIVTAANIVPPVQMADRHGLKENEKVQSKSAQTGVLEGEIQQEYVEAKDIVQKIDLSGIADWDPAIQQDSHNLISEYACIFLHNDLDLGKTSIVKHSIKLTDPTLFKVCYRRIHLECMKK